MVCYAMLWYSMVWYGMEWYGLYTHGRPVEADASKHLYDITLRVQDQVTQMLWSCTIIFMYYLR